MRTPAGLWSDVAATASTLRSRAYAILRHSDNSAGGRRWRSFHLFVLGSGLLAVAISSIDDLPALADQLLAAVIGLVAGIFLMEYAVRLWSAPEANRYAGLGEA